MAIPFTCPCGKKLQAKDEFAGRRMKCPACQRVLGIPKASARTLLAPAGAKPLPVKAKATAATAAGPGFIRFVCSCGRKMKARSGDVGATVDCPSCGRELAIPKRSSDVPAPPALEAPTPPPVRTRVNGATGGPKTENPNLVHFACICGRKMKARKADAGEAVDCPSCGRELTIPGKPAAKAPPPAPRSAPPRPAPVVLAVEPPPARYAPAPPPAAVPPLPPVTSRMNPAAPLTTRGKTAPLTNQPETAPVTARAVLAPAAAPGLFPDPLVAQFSAPWRDERYRAASGRPPSEPLVRPSPLWLLLIPLLVAGLVGAEWYGVQARDRSTTAITAAASAKRNAAPLAIPAGAVEVLTIHVQTHEGSKKRDSIVNSIVWDFTKDGMPLADELERITVVLLPIDNWAANEAAKLVPAPPPMPGEPIAPGGPGKDGPGGKGGPGKDFPGKGEPGKDFPGKDFPGKDFPGKDFPGKGGPGKDKGGKGDGGFGQPGKGDQKQGGGPPGPGVIAIGDKPRVDANNERLTILRIRGTFKHREMDIVKEVFHTSTPSTYNVGKRYFYYQKIVGRPLALYFADDRTVVVGSVAGLLHFLKYQPAPNAIQYGAARSVAETMDHHAVVASIDMTGYVAEVPEADKDHAALFKFHSLQISVDEGTARGQATAAVLLRFQYARPAEAKAAREALDKYRPRGWTALGNGYSVNLQGSDVLVRLQGSGGQIEELHNSLRPFLQWPLRPDAKLKPRT